MRRVSVVHDDGAWRVTTEGREAMRFASGRAAEEAAHRLARELADDGRGATLEVYLRDGSLAGRFAWPAQSPLVMARAA